jgi:hypothetical protein
MSTTSVVGRAQAFAAGLSRRQRHELQDPCSPALAAGWSNLPERSVRGRGQGRVGLRIGTLSAAQWTALDALLCADGPRSSYVDGARAARA